MSAKLLRVFLMFAALCVTGIAGCQDSGGTTGDQNDPAVDGTDEEMMADETGDV